MFASRELAQPWAKAGLLALENVHEVMEITYLLNLNSRAAARASAAESPPDPAGIRTYFDRNRHPDRVGEQAAAVNRSVSGER